MRAESICSLPCVFVVCGLLSVGILIMPIGSSQAAVPDSINYQGKLTRAGGGPLTGDYDLTFSIYPDDLGSPADWTETQLQVEVEQGIFSVLLGSVNPLQASLFDGSVKYLGIKVEDDPEMTPLRPMVTTSYAFHSLEADTAGYARSAPVVPDGDWVIDGNNVYREEGGVAIGASDPGQKKLYVQGGDVLVAQGELRVWRNVDDQGASFRLGYDPNYSLVIKRGYNHGTGSPSTIQSYIWPNETPDALLLNPEGGNVGIGTMSADQKLEVDGNAHITGNLRVDGSIDPAPVGCWRHSGAQIFSGIGPADWTDLDLSSYVGSNHALVLIKVKGASGHSVNIFRPNGDTDEYWRCSDLSDMGAQGHKGECAEAGLIVVETDANGIVEWKNRERDVTLTLLGYVR